MKYRRYLPYLDFYLRLPGIKIETLIFVERYESATVEYVKVLFHLLDWSFSFRLYSPWRSL